MKNTKNNNKFDCQCSLFPKKNHVNTHQNPKISMKDKDALTNKLGVEDHSQKKLINKISMNVKHQNHQKKKEIQKPSINLVKQLLIPQKQNQRKQMIPSLKNILEGPSLKFIGIQSPNAIKKTVLTSEYYNGADSSQKIKNIQFSYENKKQDQLKITRKVSVKNLKQSINIKTAQTIKRSDSEILQKNKNGTSATKQQKCYSLKQSKNLKGLVSTSITSSKNGDKSQQNSKNSQVGQNLIKKQKGSKVHFFFSKQP